MTGAARLRPTARGWSFAAVALFVLVAAPLSGQRDVLRIGVLLAVLLVVATITTARSARSLDLVSRSQPGLVEAGAPATVRLSVSARARPGVRLVVEDRAPLALGGTARLAVPRMAAGETIDLEYRLRSEVRGAHSLGPASIVARDVFGLVTATRTAGETVTLDVLPRVHRLPDLPLGELGGSRGTSASASAAAATDDVTIREYRVGDDLRRVHWRSSARRGALMVRSDEHPGRPDVVLVLDDRAVAHTGRGAASSLEWAISATASAAVHLHRNGHRVRLVHGGSFDPPLDLDETSALRGLLRALARLQPGAPDALARSITALGRTESTLLVAVLGAVDAADVAPLLSARPLGVPAVAVLQRADARAGGASAPDLRRADLVLSRAGWRTAIAEPAEEVPEVWARLGQPVAVARRRPPGAPASPGSGEEAAS